jgi:hypothetical protein
MRPVCIEVETLPAGMHPRIGPAAALNQHWLIHHPGKGRLNVVLHGATTRLPLPTVEISAIVGAYTFPSHRD